MEPGCASRLSLATPIHPTQSSIELVNDSVAVDAKRILLRYGAPIVVLDDVTEADRVAFAREIAKTALPERERRLRELLIEKGYIEVEED